MNAAGRVLWDWSHQHDIDGDSFDAILAANPVLRIIGRWSVLRAMLLWYYARSYDVLVTGMAGNTTRALLAIERLRRRPRRYLVLLHFIPETSLPPYSPDLMFIIRVIKLWLLNVLVRPVVRECALRCQTLTEWEVERNAVYFGVPPKRMHFIPYPLRTCADVMPTPVRGYTSGVMASGRGACDWPTVFAIAEGEDWPLTVVCGRRDLRLVKRLNKDGRARVLVDIPSMNHFDLLVDSSVYLLALRDLEVSSGQIRLSDAIRAGTPVVASYTAGIAEYLTDGETALVFQPGDIETARRHIRSLLEHPELCDRVRQLAFKRASVWTRSRYLAAMHDMVGDAVAEARSERHRQLANCGWENAARGGR